MNTAERSQAKGRLLSRLLLTLLSGGFCALAQTAVSQPSGWQLAYSDDFENGSLADWVSLGMGNLTGTWGIVKDGTNSVLELTNQATVELAQQTFSDFHLSMNFRPDDGGLYVGFRRSTTSCAGYWLNAGANNLNLASVQTAQCGTAANQLAAVSSPPSSNSVWHTLDLVAVGASIKIYVDSALQINFTDPSPLVAGSLLFSTSGPGRVDIDNVQIYGPPALSNAEQLVWTPTSGPPGGIGYDVRMRMDQPSRMYATDANTGVNISDDNGLTWYASNAGITARSGASADAIPIFTLTVDPHNPNVIWVGTRTARGLYKSVDQGKTYTEKTRGITEQNITFRGVTVDPNNESLIYAAAEVPSQEYAGVTIIGLSFGESKGVVYRSTDGGENWSAMWRGDALARYVLVDPRNSSVIFVSTGFFDVEAANADPKQMIGGGVGVVKSTDGGQTWRVLNQANGLTDLYIGSLAMNPGNPDNLLAGGSEQNGYSHGGQDSGVFVTFDGGETWRKGVFAASTSPGGVGPTNGTFQAVTFSPTNPAIAYAAGPGVFLRSSDSGKTWAVMSGSRGYPDPAYGYGPPGLLPGVPVALQVDPRNQDRVFQNNYTGGNFLSEDGGRTWVLASKGYSGAQVYSVGADPEDSRRVFTGGPPGLFSSTDAGDTWLGLNPKGGLGKAFSAIAVDPSQPGAVLVGDDSWGTILRSTDGGATKTTAFQQPGLYNTDFYNRHGFQAIVFAPSNPKTVYAGMRYFQEGLDFGRTAQSYGMLKSTDGGATWSYTNDSNMAGQNVNTIAVPPRDELTVYAGTIYGGVFISHDGGSSWRASNKGLPLVDVRALVIDSTNPSTIYAGLEGRGAWKSTDAGATWQFASSGLDPQSAIRKMVMDPTDSRVLYAGEANTGVYRTIDGGALWEAVNRGLTNRAVTYLAISPDGATLWAATNGAGVERLNVRNSVSAPVSAVSAASYAPAAPLAPDSIAALFGSGLASGTVIATTQPLPAMLGDTTVAVTDSAGADRVAPLLYVAAGQIGCLLPAGLATGAANLRVLVKGNTVARGMIMVNPVAPGLFTANSNGLGAPQAVVLKVAADGTQTTSAPYVCAGGAGSCVAAPIDLGSPGDQVYLLLYGTGVRGVSGQITATIGGLAVPVAGAAAQGQFAGLDQINLQLPRTLAGLGEVDLLVTVDGKAANVVRVNIR